jgi:hypothetical protein
VGSGGVLRHAEAAAARAVLAPLLADHAGGWKVPEHAPVAVDRQYVLAAAGLLAAEAPVAGRRSPRRWCLPDPGVARCPLISDVGAHTGAGDVS